MKHRRGYFLRLSLCVLCGCLLAGLLALAAVYAVLICRIPVDSTAAVLYVLFAFLCCCLVSTLLIYVTEKKEKKLISEIRQMLDRVASGDFSAKISLTNTDRRLDEIIVLLNKVIGELNSVAILKNDFINNFSHEFKTPIASIKGFSKLLCRNKELPEETRQRYLSIINEESARLANLANMTMLLSKFKSQSVIFDREKICVNEQIEECVLQLYAEVEKKKLNVVCGLSPFCADGSRKLLKELWLNLFSNAVKYTADGGCIRILSRETPTEYIVEFKDDGIGIGEEAQKHIFDAYYQENALRGSRGIGLGLTICRRIVDLHNWTIGVQSVKSQGSTFYVRIPNQTIPNSNTL